MAAAFDHGAIQWNSADAVNTTYTVNLASGFNLKGIRFYWVGIGSATDATSTTAHTRRGVGFATGTTSRRAIGSLSLDSQADSACAGIASDDCIAVTLDGLAAVTGKLDITTFSSEQFILTVDDTAPVNITVFWEAYGGSEITVATVGDIAEPAATGVQTYTVTGFTSGATDQVVMFAGCQSTAAVNTGANTDSGLHVGFATGTASANNITFVGNSDDASATMDTDRYCQAGECISMIVVGGGNPDATAQLTQFNTDNFGLNWTARALTGRRSIFMALKGCAWSAGSYTIDGSTLNSTATVSGLSFQPVGLSMAFIRSATLTQGTSTTHDFIGLGSGSSTTSRRSMGVFDENAALNSSIGMTVQYDQVLTYINSSGTVGPAYDISAINSDGFTIITDVATGSATEFHGYLAFGSAAVSSNIYGLLLMGCGT